ncbi:MAG: single-stranded-DNA-specific exonuclease RecJ, partial [Leptospira sp.]|nr:single-stranded-DNA-specific exonuclease RecJ [Leptospira sp.]
PATLPPGALVNPKRDDSIYPDKKICTAFLALKFTLAFLFRNSDEYDKIYKITNANELIGYFQNGVSISEENIATMQKDGRIQSEEIELNALPGNESIPASNRIFYHQLTLIPGILQHQYEASGLAGIGTITDMMPLVGENRSLVRFSCHFLGYSLQGKIEGTPGLNQILKNLKLRPEKVSSKDMGWGIGPLLNAAGRMGRTELAFDLLLADHETIAFEKTQELIKTNEERKERTKRNIHKVNLYFQRHPHKTEKPIIFCYEPDLEPGVSGIVATRLVETYAKPAIFITPDHGTARGSIRSAGRENVLELLKTAEDILGQFGGHPEAGGFSIDIQKIPDLEARFYETAPNWLAMHESVKKEIHSDIECRPEDLKPIFYQQLEKLEPTGQGNPPILISLKDIQPIHFNFMGDGKHARFRVMKAGSLKFVIWNAAEKLSRFLSLNPRISIWGHLEENHFNGKTSLQFLVQHYE